MAPDTLIDATTDFGRRVRERLTEESVAWLTTVGRDGTPQPNPVWFLWDGDSEVVVYNLPSAHRLTHIAERPQVALHLNSDVGGGDVAVLRGVAEVADDLPAADVSEPYLAKYADAMREVVGSTEEFATTYSVPLRIRLEKLRGF